MKLCNKHPDAELVREPRVGQHEFAIVCSVCNKWVAWAKKEKTVAEIEDRRKVLKGIILKGGLDDAGLQEVLDCYIIEKPNYKQQDMYSRIKDRYLADGL